MLENNTQYRFLAEIIRFQTSDILIQRLYSYPSRPTTVLNDSCSLSLQQFLLLRSANRRGFIPKMEQNSGNSATVDGTASTKPTLTYRTAGNIGGELNLAVWRLGKRPSNLNPSNLSAIYACACAHIICTELPPNLNLPIFLFWPLGTKRQI